MKTSMSWHRLTQTLALSRYLLRLPRKLPGLLLLATLAFLAGMINQVQSAPPTPGSLFAWGGDYDEGQTSVPVGSDFVAVAAGYRHSLSLRANGSLVAWGSNNEGQSTVPAGNDFIAIAGGGNNSLALRADGSLVDWGVGNAGVPAGSDFVAISTGGIFSLALRANGSLVGWGHNAYGQTANVPAGNNFVAIASGPYHGLALRADGSLAAWGDPYVVGIVPEGNDFVAIAASDYHSVALRADGSLVDWGYISSEPPAGNSFVAIAAGLYRGMALRADGSLAGWGDNSFGQADFPAGTFVAIAAGPYHGLAIGSAAPVPSELILDLIAEVVGLNLQHGIENSLDSKLEAAFQALDDASETNDIAAVYKLTAFINAVQAQRGKKIPSAAADSLIDAALDIIELLLE